MATQQDPDTTLMVHYSCGACRMTATVVDNHVSRSAWDDHMRSHANVLHYDYWCWTIVRLPLDL